MKVKKNRLVFASLLLAAGATNAQTPRAESGRLYAEIGYQNIAVKSDFEPEYSPKVNALSGIIGYQFHPNVSAEFLLATGMSDQNTVVRGQTVATKLNHTYGVMIRPSVMFNDQLEGFVRVGYGKTKVSVSDSTGSASMDEGSYILGVGANYHFTKNVYGQLSYTSFHNKDGVSLRGFGASVGYKF